mgnify:CR=1 FL=1
MNRVYEKVMKCYENIKNRIPFTPKVALVLGSGLGNYANQMKIEMILPYSDIPEFPVSTVPGHNGRFIFGYVKEVPVVCMQGRVHYYEGYGISDIVLPIRLMKLMGAEILFLTNAAGGMGEDFAAGDLMLITDHISCFVPNPLIGENIEEFGTRFPDMSHIYQENLQRIIRHQATEHHIPLQEGVYVQLTGPSFESPAEINMLKRLGGDAVGMSTAVEAIAANHMGMQVCGISCISNLAAGLTANPLTHAEVQESADKAAPLFEKLVTESIAAF